MRQLVSVILVIVTLVDFTSTQGQYPNCEDTTLSCRDSTSMPISPSLYTTMRSDRYPGAQPTNDGCTPVDGQGTINCGVGTTLMDCNNGNRTHSDYTDLSNYFVWNRAINQPVSLVFTFDQPVNISGISLYFWSQLSAAVTIPNLMLYWSNDDSTTPSNEVSFDQNTFTIIGTEKQRRRRNLNITDRGLLFQHLRIMMTITEGIHIFLSEVLFCGTISTTTTLSTAVAITATTTLNLSSTIATTGAATTTSTFLSTTVTPSYSSSASSDNSSIGIIVGVIVVVFIVVLIVTGAVITLVVWKKKKSGSIKPEGVYYSTIDEGTLQTSLPNKPEPIYTEMSDEQNNAKSISITNPTQKSVPMQNNPAYSNPKEQVVLQDNPAYGSAAKHIKK